MNSVVVSEVRRDSIKVQWEDIPTMSEYFAIGECLACLPLSDFKIGDTFCVEDKIGVSGKAKTLR